MSPTLFLASRSPRRRELLAQAGLRFQVYVPREEEIVAPPRTGKEKPGSIVKRISRAKAEAAYRELREAGTAAGVILSADTLVFQAGKVLGKPANEADAIKMLGKLSGRWHEVCTGVTVLRFKGDRIAEKTIFVSSKVKFFSLKKEWIRWYVATGEPMDKAGAYGAQAHGAVFIEKFAGSYSNVVGLPLGQAVALLEEVTRVKRTKLMEGKL